MNKKDIINGIFVSYWSDGKVVTPCELDIKTGELFPVVTNVGDLGNLESEKFYTGDEDGDEYDVCPVCHESILKTVMKEGLGKQLNEVLICSNPDCDSHNNE